MKKNLCIGIGLLIAINTIAQGFATFNVEGAYTATFLKNNTKTNSVIETIVGMDVDITNLNAKYKLLSNCSFAEETPYSTDFTHPQTLTIQKKDGTVKDWNLIVHQLQPADLPLHIDFGKNNPCDLTFSNPKPWAGYGIDYSKSTVARFGNHGVGFMVAFNGEAKTVTYTLSVVGKDNPPFLGEFDVEVSTDGKKWKTLKTFAPTDAFVSGEPQTHALNADVRFVRWVYAVREKQNVNLNHITIQ